MPITFQIDRAKSLVIGRATGHVRLPALRSYLTALHSALDPGFLLLLDATECVKVTLPKDQAAPLAGLNLAKVAKRRAILVTEPLAIGLQLLYPLHRETLRDEGFGVFLNRMKALAWLGIENAHNAPGSRPGEPLH